MRKVKSLADLLQEADAGETAAREGAGGGNKNIE
jgi:hypothetical protein